MESDHVYPSSRDILAWRFSSTFHPFRDKFRYSLEWRTNWPHNSSQGSSLRFFCQYSSSDMASCLVSDFGSFPLGYLCCTVGPMEVWSGQVMPFQPTLALGPKNSQFSLALLLNLPNLSPFRKTGIQWQLQQGFSLVCSSLHSKHFADLILV